MKENEIIEILRQEDEEFKKIEEEHRALDEKIAEIDKNRYLTTEEEVEKKKLQKQKLIKKDQMAEIVRNYKKSQSN
ncbi:hypothetical protein BMS3Abin07_00313 [bacterium BMS3Abin07]|nr:hypothetical protein BMS3Abin07_00313 [bacterium BMS3Abin07]GBE31782.1 hypothetical protein BMS3Bbin05_00685 [bacterium BMS3Bbin05]HDO22332.1 DUF465 domain-containing protein [Nitrospirota bacterium]